MITPRTFTVRLAWLVLLAVLCAASPASAQTREAEAIADLKAAEVKKSQGDFTSAMQLYNRAIRSGQLPPIKLSGAHFRRGLTLGAIGDQPAMLEDLAQAVKLNPDNTYFRLGYGSALYQAGEVGMARAQYRAAVDLEPLNPLPVSALGVTFWDQGDYDQAEALLKKAAGLKPSSAWGRDKLGTFYLSLGRFGDAAEAFAAGAKLDPKSAELPLLTFIARALGGRVERGLLAKGAALAGGQWPAEAYELFMGKTSPERYVQWLGQDKDPAGQERRVAARYFLAYFHLWKKQETQARSLFDWLAANTDPTSLSHPAARAELRRRGLVQ